MRSRYRDMLEEEHRWKRQSQERERQREREREREEKMGIQVSRRRSME